MIRTQIQLTPEQASSLKKLAAKEKKSIAEMVRLSVDAMIQAKGIYDQGELRSRAIRAAGQCRGPEDLSANHDDYLSETYEG